MARAAGSAADIVDRYMGAWNAQDAVAVRQCFTPEGCYIDSIQEQEIVGDEIIAYCEASFERYPDMHYDIVNRTGTHAGAVAVQWVMRGRDIEPIFNLPASGDNVSFVGVDFLRLRRGRIHACTSYYDVSSLQRGVERSLPVAPSRDELEKYQRSRLSDNAVRDIRRSLEQFLALHGYRDPDLTLALLAQRMATSPTYLSQVINREFGMSFRDLVNSRRVAAAAAMLRDPDQAGTPVMQIGLASGFNSASAFYAAFQRFAGTTPLSFRKRDRQAGAMDADHCPS
jgi:steroid delta-isomerase-like uncharacterized protein